MIAMWLAQLNESRLWKRPVVLRGMRFVPPSLDRWVALQGHRLGLMGTAEFNLFEKFVHPASHIADVGANQGVYTLALARLATLGKVYAFEPDPGLFRALKQNIQTNGTGNVLLFNAAASSRESKLVLRRGRFNRGDNRIVRNGLASGAAIQVESVRLDDVIPRQRLDLLKIDVQGFEVDVLRGAKQLLLANPELLILLEFWPHGLRLAGSQPEELHQLLNDAGFSPFRLGDNSVLRPFVYDEASWSRPDRFCNLVAVKDPRLIRKAAEN